MTDAPSGPGSAGVRTGVPVGARGLYLLGVSLHPTAPAHPAPTHPAPAPQRRSRRARRPVGERLPPYDGPGAVAPPLRWARRFTPLGIGRRGVRLEMAGGWLTVVRVPVVRADRVVVSAPASEFHGLAVSRGGRGLHLWHGTRLFRLVGSTAGSDDGTGNDVSSSSSDDPVSAVLTLLFLPVYLFAAIGAYTEKVREQRRNVDTTLRWLAPVVGHSPPGLDVRPPLPGGWLAAGRWVLRLAVLGALVAGLLAVL